MLIGDKLRRLREDKNLSQGDIEKRTGLLRCYISRVENGHTVRAAETLEKFARALEVPVYQLFYEGRGELHDGLLEMSLLFRWPMFSSKHLPEAQSYQDARTAIENKITPELKHAHDDLIGEAYWLCQAEDRKWP